MLTKDEEGRLYTVFDYAEDRAAEYLEPLDWIYELRERVFAEIAVLKKEEPDVEKQEEG